MSTKSTSNIALMQPVKGYGIASYLRFTDMNQNVHCALTMGKSWVKPKKPITIPRAELIAAVVAVKQHLQIMEELEYQVNRTFFWTDPMVVRQYLSNEVTRYQAFTANHVQFIRDYRCQAVVLCTDQGQPCRPRFTRLFSFRVQESGSLAQGFLFLVERRGGLASFPWCYSGRSVARYEGECRPSQSPSLTPSINYWNNMDAGRTIYESLLIFWDTDNSFTLVSGRQKYQWQETSW